MKWMFLISLIVCLVGCRRESPQQAADDFALREITLPRGQVIKVETMIEDRDRLRGMMFRTSLAPDHGMLFVHPKPGLYSYWMYQMQIPLDTIWIDANHHVVEIAENLPPCLTKASQCPHFGGDQISEYEIQLGGGMAKKYGLQAGQTIQW
jgi:uncharacterized membrane protein (UPF0127 family)